MPNETEVKLQYTADATGALTVTDKLGNRLTGLRDTSDSVFSAMRGSWMMFAASAATASAAVYKAWQWADEGVRITQAEEAFKRAADAITINADRLIEAIQKASNYTIDDSDAMQQAFKNLSAGMDPDKIVQLAEVARLSARRMGEDVVVSYTAISDAIETMRTKALVQYGLLTKDQAKLVESVRGAGHEYDLMNLVLANYRVQLGLAGGVTENSAERWQQEENRIHNLWEKWTKLVGAITDYLLLQPRLKTAAEGARESGGLAQAQRAYEAARWNQPGIEIPYQQLDDQSGAGWANYAAIAKDMQERRKAEQERDAEVEKLKRLSEEKERQAEAKRAEAEQQQITERLQQMIDRRNQIYAQAAEDADRVEWDRQQKANQYEQEKTEYLASELQRRLNLEDSKAKKLIDLSREAGKNSEEDSRNILDESEKKKLVILEEYRIEKYKKLLEQQQQADREAEAQRQAEIAVRESKRARYEAAWTGAFDMANSIGGEAGQGVGKAIASVKGITDVYTKNDRYTKEYEQAVEHYVKMEQETRAHTDRDNALLAEADALMLAHDQMVRNQKLSIASNTFGTLAGMAQAFYALSGQQSMAAFRAYQAFAIAETTISTIEAAQHAYRWGAKLGGPVLGAVFAAAAVAAGMARIAQIAQQKPSAAATTSTSSLSSGGYTYTSPTESTYESTTTTTEQKKNIPSINIYVYGNVVDGDKFARELVPSITKALNDGVS